MEPESPLLYLKPIAFEVISTGAEESAKALDQAPRKPLRLRLHDWVDLRLTVGEAGIIYEKLLGQTQSQFWASRLSKPQRPGDAFSDPAYLLRALQRALKDLPPTTQSTYSYSNVHVREREFLMRVLRHEAAYFRTILSNQELDEERRKAFEESLFVPLEVVEMAEEGLEPEELTDGVRRAFAYTTHHENPDARLRGFFLKEALSELPAVLKMAEPEVEGLLSALAESGGNVSQAARQTGQPQRKTARRVARMLRHLKSRGFSA